MSKQLYHYINGQKVEGTSGRFGDIYNPATGAVSARVPLASASETAQAIELAAAAFPGLARYTTPEQGARTVSLQGTA